ncbi:MAG TPA: hypothetical protein DEH78_23250 [Solibacterales bacterium]|nr:hypothetical protein [Bryobacterales bacterium]
MEQWRSKEVARLLALVEAERRYYQDLIANLPTPLMVLSIDKHLVYANRACRELLGLRYEDIGRMRVDSLLPSPELAEALDKRRACVLAMTVNGIPLSVAVRLTRSWEDPDTEEFLLVLESSDEGGSAGPAAQSWEVEAAMLGATALDARLERVDAGDRPKYRAFVEQASGSVGRHWLQYRSADGRTLLCLAESDGRRAKMLELDVTERHQEQERERLSEKMTALGRLASRVAHDCNNALMVISGYGEEIAAALPAESRQDLQAMLEAAGRISALMNQLVLLTDRRVVRPALLDLDRYLGERAGAQTFRPGAPGAMVAIDAAEFDHGLSALVERANALQAAYTISTRLIDGHRVRIEFADDGPRPSEADLRQSFEPFVGSLRGSGLGLAALHTLVRLAGGEITAHPGERRGAVFQIELPRADEGIAQERPPRPAVTVLVVEDEPGIRSLVRKHLERQGYTVLDAASGEEALQVSAAHRQPLELLITDVVMPKITGPDLLRRLRAQRPELKAIFISGYADDPAVHKLAEGSGGFLQKPFSLVALSKAVKDALGQ